MMVMVMIKKELAKAQEAKRSSLASPANDDGC